MKALGIFNGKDLKQKELNEMIDLFGKSGKHFYNIVRGIHHSKVNPNRIRKSLAVEQTFTDDLQLEEDVFKKLKELSSELFYRFVKKNIKGRTMTLKKKYKDLYYITTYHNIN